jgi:hypothetical protein
LSNKHLPLVGLERNARRVSVDHFCIYHQFVVDVDANVLARGTPIIFLVGELRADREVDVSATCGVDEAYVNIIPVVVCAAKDGSYRITFLVRQFDRPELSAVVKIE